MMLVRSLMISAALLVFSAPLLGALEGQDAGATDTIAVTLDTIPVIGSRVNSTLPVRSRSVEVLDRESLDALPASTVAEALRWTLGVELGLRSPAQSDISMRGAGFENVLVLVDGVRMSDPQTGHFDLNLTLPLEGVDRIEILRGPASALYGGDAVGGVVNVVTRGPAGWNMALEGGSFGTFRGSVQGTLELPADAHLSVSAEEGRSDGHRDGTDWDHRLLNTALSMPFLDGGIRGDMGYATRDFGAEGFYSPHPSFESTATSTASLRWRPDHDARIRIEPRIAWRSHDDDFILIREDPGVYRNQHTSTQLTGDVVVRGEVRPGLGVAVGGELQRSRLESNSLGDRREDRRSWFAEVGWESEEGAVGGVRRTASDRARGVLPGMGVTVGLRYDDHDTWGSAVSPSASGYLVLAPAVRVRGSWGRAFRGPSWTERYYVDPAHTARSDLDPERSGSIDAALVLGSPGRTEVSLGVFRRNSRDLIDWARPPGEEDAIWETRNVSRAIFRGLELEGRWSPGGPGSAAGFAGALSDGGLVVTAGISLLSIDADAEPGLESKYALRPLTEEIVAGIARDLGAGVRGSMRILHGRRPAESPHREVDLRFERPFATGRAHLEFRNLLDSDHLDLTGNPVRGRSIVLGYGLSLH